MFHYYLKNRFEPVKKQVSCLIGFQIEWNGSLLVGMLFYSSSRTSWRKNNFACLSAKKKRILSRTVPENPEWSGSGNKFTQQHHQTCWPLPNVPLEL